MKRIIWFAIALIFGLSLCLSGCSGGGSSHDIGISSGENYYYNDHVYPYSPGWYHGVLHSHALYDAGESLTPISKVVAIAEDQGFDFFVITNHNTVFQWSDPGYRSDKLTILYGVEWTTGQGHANIWSNQPFDWDAIVPTVTSQDVADAINTAHSLASQDRPILFSINHPNRPSSPWKASLEESKHADSIEVWNGSSIYMSPTDTFSSYIGDGLKMTMLGGSDAHLKSASGTQTYTENLGRPTTWVYADSKSGKDILTGIKKGHAFISASPDGPRLDFNANIDLDIVMMGDTMPANDLGKFVNFTVSVSDASVPYGVVIVKNGVPQEGWSHMFSSSDNSFSFTDSPEAHDYYRVEVRQLTDQPVPFDELLLGPISAISNPIYTW